MFASAKRKQQKKVGQLQCQEQRIDHIPHYLSGLSRAHFFRPFSKELYVWSFNMTSCDFFKGQFKSSRNVSGGQMGELHDCAQEQRLPENGE